MRLSAELTYDWICSVSKYYSIGLPIDLSYQDTIPQMILTGWCHICKAIWTNIIRQKNSHPLYYFMDGGLLIIMWLKVVPKFDKGICHYESFGLSFFCCFSGWVSSFKITVVFVSLFWSWYCKPDNKQHIHRFILSILFYIVHSSYRNWCMYQLLIWIYTERAVVF